MFLQAYSTVPLAWQIDPLEEECAVSVHHRRCIPLYPLVRLPPKAQGYSRDITTVCDLRHKCLTIQQCTHVQCWAPVEDSLVG